MITYAYERVSSKEQNLERQDTAIKTFRPDISEANIFRDKMTGKTFDREGYNAMKVILAHVAKANENSEMVEVVFEEMDRWGEIRKVSRENYNGTRSMGYIPEFWKSLQR